MIVLSIKSYFYGTMLKTCLMWLQSILTVFNSTLSIRLVIQNSMCFFICYSLSYHNFVMRKMIWNYKYMTSDVKAIKIIASNLKGHSSIESRKWRVPLCLRFNDIWFIRRRKIFIFYLSFHFNCFSDRYLTLHKTSLSQNGSQRDTTGETQYMLWNTCSKY